MEKKFKSSQKTFFIITDFLFIIVSYLAAILFLDKSYLMDDTYYFVVTIAFCCAFHNVSFECFELYNTIWIYAGLRDYFKLVRTMIIDVFTVMVIFFFLPNNYDVKMILLAGIFSTVLIAGSRVAIRVIVNRISDYYKKSSVSNKKNLLIVGAGNAARVIINDINLNANSPYNIVGLIDDNVDKIGCFVSGAQVLGNRNSIPKIVEMNAVEEIVIAIPSLEETDRQEIVKICNETSCSVKILPSVYRFVDAKSSKNMLSKLRDIQIEDLLVRDPIVLDNASLSGDIKGKTILVTGGGGSIGSELCRQIADFAPEKLVIVDIYENNAYDIQNELLSDHPDLDIDVIIASVRDESRMEYLFEKYKPYAVFHAAAHKHVPLMEASPSEAIKNNVFGTYNLAKCADKYNVDRFVLVSTDKAVNPTNIMGASKRMCEMIIQAMQTISKTKFVAVRFGNVLGSNGSVVPLFKKQIAAGGPITLTHKDITRFFMTIPEAVSLILQSYSYAEGGEIFILDMGKPVRIYDLAVNLIRLSGFKPNDDIKIEIVGLRPGEKLYEELLMDEEGIKKTAHSKIFVARPTFNDINTMKEKLAILKKAAESNDAETIYTEMQAAVPTYVHNNEDVACMKKSYNLAELKV